MKSQLEKQIIAVAVAFALILTAFFWLLTYEPKTPDKIASQIAPQQRTTPVATFSSDLGILTPKAPENAVKTPTAPVETSTPIPTPTLDDELRRIFGDDVEVNRLSGGFLTVRWRLSDLDTDRMLADADRRIAEAMPLVDDFVLVNFEGTSGIRYPDGRRTVEVVYWITVEGNTITARKESPVLRR